MKNYFLIFIGGGLGACLRFFISLMAYNILNSSFPWGTFIINIAGSFLLGLVAAYSINKPDFIDGNFKLFITTGFAGGFTTFSTFSWEFLTLLREGFYVQGLLYSVGSLLLGLMAAFIAFILAKLI